MKHMVQCVVTLCIVVTLCVIVLAAITKSLDKLSSIVMRVEKRLTTIEQALQPLLSSCDVTSEKLDHPAEKVFDDWLKFDDSGELAGILNSVSKPAVTTTVYTDLISQPLTE